MPLQKETATNLLKELEKAKKLWSEFFVNERLKTQVSIVSAAGSSMPEPIDKKIQMSLDGIFANSKQILEHQQQGIDATPSVHGLEARMHALRANVGDPPKSLFAQEALRFAYIAETLALSEYPTVLEKAEALAEKKMGWVARVDYAGELTVEKTDGASIAYAKKNIGELHRIAKNEMTVFNADAHMSGTVNMAFNAVVKIAEARSEGESLRGAVNAAIGRTELETAFNALSRARMRTQDKAELSAIESCRDCLEAAEKIAKETTKENHITVNQALRAVGGSHLEL